MTKKRAGTARSGHRSQYRVYADGTVDPPIKSGECHDGLLSLRDFV